MKGNGKRGHHFSKNHNVQDFDIGIQETSRLMFEKQFVYTQDDSKLPESFANSSLWTDAFLEESKLKLNEVKNRLSHLDINSWHKHTSATNKAGEVIALVKSTSNPELCTQAWCKFYEVLNAYPFLIEGFPLNSVHLCEAPGAFISCLNHFLCLKKKANQWQWMANTLNPYFEGNSATGLIGDDRLIIHTLNQWCFGNDNSGDILVKENIEDITQQAGGLQPVYLVTSDGSIDCANNPAEQEIMVSQLLYNEIVTGLRILAPGGHMVIKFFTMFETSTVCYMYLLHCVFKKVHVFKPATSKSGNSEVYVVCECFTSCSEKIHSELQLRVGQDIQFPLFSKDEIPETFHESHRQCCAKFTQYQMDTIQKNLDLFEDFNPREKEFLNNVRQCCALMYIQRYKLRSISAECRIVPHYFAAKKKVKQQCSIPPIKAYFNKPHEGSYMDRTMPWVERLKNLHLYDISTPDDVWIERDSQLDVQCLSEWMPQQGRQIHHVTTSRLCNMLYMQKLHDIKTNCQCQETDNRSSLPDFLESLKEQASFNRAVSLQCDNISRGGHLWQSACDILQADDETLGTNVHVVDPFSALTENYKRSLIADLTRCFKTMKEGDGMLFCMRPCLSRVEAGLIYLLDGIFEKLCVRTTVGSRGDIYYVMALNFQLCPEEVISLLDRTLERLSQLPRDQDVVELVPIKVLLESGLFEVLVSMNDTFLMKKVNALLESECERLSININKQTTKC